MLNSGDGNSTSKDNFQDLESVRYKEVGRFDKMGMDWLSVGSCAAGKFFPSSFARRWPGHHVQPCQLAQTTTPPPLGHVC